MLHTAIFIGRSGCGKGTQAALFMEEIRRLDHRKRHTLYVESGEQFRSFLRGKSHSSSLASEISKKGDRQPDFLAVYVWGSQLIEELDADMHLVFDGVARSKPEAVMLTTALEFYKRAEPTVFYINVGRHWSEERLLARKRADDIDLFHIDKRLDWFDRDVLPAVEYFKQEPLYRFIEVDGEQTIEAVHRELIAKYERKKH